MNFVELAKKRCSIRKYAPVAIEKDKIEYILEAARLAPSAVNYQPWHFLLVTETEGCEKVHKCYPREWIKSASCFIIVCGDHSLSWKRGDEKDHMDIDTAIAAEHICLAAAEQGLGTCWVCNFDNDLCRELFNCPDAVEPVVIIPIGYPAPPDLFETTPKKRKSIEEIIKRETF